MVHDRFLVVVVVVRNDDDDGDCLIVMEQEQTLSERREKKKIYIKVMSVLLDFIFQSINKLLLIFIGCQRINTQNFIA